MKSRGRRPSAFTVFEGLKTPMKHEARVFINCFSIVNHQVTKNNEKILPDFGIVRGI